MSMKTSIRRLCVLALSILPGVLLLAQNPLEINIERDGIILSGKFYKAAGIDRRPTLILLQGSPGNQWDVLGIGRAVSEKGVNALTFNYTGTHLSQGLFSFPNCLADVSAVYRFLRDSRNIEKFGIDTSKIFLSGYSLGGGMAMTYAIKHREINSVISIAGNDWGEYFEDYMSDPAMKANFDGNLKKAVDAGIIRFEPGKMPGEMGENWLKSTDPAFYTKNNAARLAGKNILLICGWDDSGVTMERHTLPLYRELKKNQGQTISIMAFQDDHTFGKSRLEIAQAIIKWISVN
jgi:dipeptidyl aminopeptidase/acylaminoacyl peptidase